MIFDVIFGDFFIGTGEPPPYCDKIPTKSQFCMVVVLVLKSWDWVRPPSPPVGQPGRKKAVFYDFPLYLDKVM